MLLDSEKFGIFSEWFQDYSDKCVLIGGTKNNFLIQAPRSFKKYRIVDKKYFICI